MIKLKGNVIQVTGKDAKLLKKYARKYKMSQKKLLLECLMAAIQKYTFIDKDISLEKLS
jgi:hypothetical protein